MAAFWQRGLSRQSRVERDAVLELRLNLHAPVETLGMLYRNDRMDGAARGVRRACHFRLGAWLRQWPSVGQRGSLWRLRAMALSGMSLAAQCSR